MTRRRYRLTSNPDFQLLHYTSIQPDSSRVPIQTHAIKVKPRDPEFIHKLARLNQSLASQTPSNVIPPTPTHPYQPQGHSQGQQQPKKKPKPRQNYQVRVVEEEGEPSGDELDGSVNRTVAMERYKRNHMFIDQIFSPFSTSALVSKQEPKSISTVELSQEMQDLEKEMQQLGEQFQKRKQQLTGKSMTRRLDEIEKVEDSFQFENLQRIWSQEWNKTIQITPALVIKR